MTVFSPPHLNTQPEAERNASAVWFSRSRPEHLTIVLPAELIAAKATFTLCQMDNCNQMQTKGANIT